MNVLATSGLLVCSSLGVFAQGTIQFRNYVPSTTPPVDAPVYLDYVGGVPLSGTNPNYRAALVGGPNTGTPWSLTEPGTLQMTHNPSFPAITWVNFDSGTLPGQTPGYVTAGSTSTRLIPGAEWGTWAMVQMVAWEGPYTSWSEAWQAAQGGSVRIGVSNPLTLLLPANPVTPFETFLWGLQPFAIQLVPEPSTTSLAGLALAGYILARRRRTENSERR